MTDLTEGRTEAWVEIKKRINDRRHPSARIKIIYKEQMRGVEPKGREGVCFCT